MVRDGVEVVTPEPEAPEPLKLRVDGKDQLLVSPSPWLTLGLYYMPPEFALSATADVTAQGAIRVDPDRRTQANLSARAMLAIDLKAAPKCGSDGGPDCQPTHTSRRTHAIYHKANRQADRTLRWAERFSNVGMRIAGWLVRGKLRKLNRRMGQTVVVSTVFHKDVGPRLEYVLCEEC